MDLEDDTADSSSEPHLLLGFITANIVGLNQYPGTISGREMVFLHREPLSPHDPNAIKVLNTRSIQLGHIEPTVASVLSPLIDSNDIIVEAIVPNPRSKPNRYGIPCQLHIFTQLHSFQEIRNLIQNANLQLSQSQAQAVQETRAEKRFKRIDAVFRLVDESLQSKKRVYYALEPPRGVIKSELLDHQKEGLGWLVSRESSDELPPFWEEREKGEFVNILTNFKTTERPELLRGGILADAMGLGKTLTLLSLIAFDKGRGFGDNVEKKGSDSRKIVSDWPFDDLDFDFFDDELLETNATLVVCTPSAMATWMTQLEEHTVPGSLRTYKYYGDKRTGDADELKKHDLVLTTYGTLSMEAYLDETPMKKLEWRRIILDEAHNIENFKTKQSRMVTGLNAKRRWAVTGTPIQNGSLDLFSLMEFLHFVPFSIRSYWRSFVQRPLNQGLQSGLMRLQVLMAAISLRRTKDNGLPGLPPKTIETHCVELDSEEREVYDKVHEDSRNTILSYIRNDGIVGHYSRVLSMILRLRQICTNMAMCPKDLASVFPSDKIEDISNNPELLPKLVEKLQKGEDIECPICMSPSVEIVITCCTHIFCRPCILKTLKCSPSCPLCRHTLKVSDLFSAPRESSMADSTGPWSSSKTRLSSKTSALIKLLAESRDQNPAAKSVVFSQFWKMLALLSEPLTAAGFKTLCLDGSMSPELRAQVIDQFQSCGRDGPTVLLASLTASGEGINLTAASRVYFMEPWWNPAVEEQAMDRVHRIGQKEAVKIVRFVAKDSIEEKILKLQEKKKMGLARETFGRGSKDVGMGLDDLRFLMSI